MNLFRWIPFRIVRRRTLNALWRDRRALREAKAEAHEWETRANSALDKARETQAFANRFVREGGK